jgi:hypothetical protein
VLALGEPSDHDIRTLVTFDVYRTLKVISVGHVDHDGCPWATSTTKYMVDVAHVGERASDRGRRRTKAPEW